MTTAKVTSTDIEATSTSSQQLSKNQMKKRRRMEKALEIKQRKKQQKKQVRYEKAKAEGRDIDAERIEQEEARKHSATNAQRMKRIQEWQGKMIPKIRQPFQICIDCSYESYMTPKEINSLAIQIRYCYSSNKRSHLPCKLTATSLGHCTIKNEIVKKADTKSKDDGDADADHNKCQTLNHLQKVNGFDEWTNFAFQITSDSFDQYFQNQRQNVVYLTSDSENTITTLENDKIYIIGGIVDRNRYKQLTYQRATSLGIATAKLPIDEYLSAMPSTRVLTTNHVFDLLIKYKEYNGCWKKALADVLPVRKDAKFAEEVKLEIDENEH
jgi:tRNA (guanine9-N1)-methyltransferase